MTTFEYICCFIGFAMAFFLSAIASELKALRMEAAEIRKRLSQTEPRS